MRNRRLAWWLVWLYPPGFRRELGLSLVDAIDDHLRARCAAGVSPLRAAAAAIADTVSNAPLEWMAACRHRSPRRATFASGERTMSDLLRQDLRYALRAWRRRPGFAFVAVLTLALGIAATTAMFSVVNAVLLRAIPYRDADRLVMLWGRTPANPQTLVSYRTYDAVRRDARAFDGSALWLSQSVNLTGNEQPQRIIGAFVTGSLFDVLGLTAERGRLFRQDESEPGAAQPVAVITHAFWQQRFGGDPAAVGAVITLNGSRLTVVGVLAPPFDPASVPGRGWFVDCDAFIPVGLFPGRNDLSGAGPSLIGVAKLKAGVSLDAANADLDIVSKRLQREFPATEGGRSLRAVSVQETIVGTSRPMLLLLLASVGAVLLIACANVSNLLLARAVDRQKEMALRAALGASRYAVARQLLVEAALLTLAGGTAGVLAAWWSLQTLASVRPPNVPVPARIPMDASVLLFAFGVSALVAIVCGVMPALRAGRVDLSAAVQAGSRRSTGSGARTREWLVAFELALTLALLATSGLLVRSLVAVSAAPLGFDPSHVFTLQLRLAPARYASKEDIARFFGRAIDRIRAVPGVQAAAFVRAVPLSGNGGTSTFVVEGRPEVPGSEPQASYHLVTPDYFRTLRIPLRAGRDFTDRDDLQAPLVAVVSDTFARTIWPGEDPIGKRIKTPDLPDWLTVIGVVADAKHLGPTDPPRPQLYVSHYQNPQIFTSLVARTAVAPMAVASDVRQAIWSVDKDQPLWAVQSLETIVDANEGQWRFLAGLVGLFAVVAVLLAAVGVYGVMAYAVAQRTHEIGVRLALGASTSRVVREVVARGVRLIAMATVAGTAMAIAAARLATSVLYGVAPHDPVALSVAAAVLAAVASLACYVPARRAARVDPTRALNVD